MVMKVSGESFDAPDTQTMFPIFLCLNMFKL